MVAAAQCPGEAKGGDLPNERLPRTDGGAGGEAGQTSGWTDMGTSPLPATCLPPCLSGAVPGTRGHRWSQQRGAPPVPPPFPKPTQALAAYARAQEDLVGEVAGGGGGICLWAQDTGGTGSARGARALVVRQEHHPEHPLLPTQFRPPCCSPSHPGEGCLSLPPSCTPGCRRALGCQPPRPCPLRCP